MWNNEEKIKEFYTLWNERPSHVMKHDKERWEQRAFYWEKELQEDEEARKRSERRIADVTKFLLQNGALKPEYETIDIGCGPGRFVTEFAKHVKTSYGTDISENMCKFGKEFGLSQGITNTEFIPADFATADIESLEWNERFDLVFSCITPAVSRPEGIEKVIKMSRKWCFNGSFLDVYDGLPVEMSEKIFGKPFVGRWNGRSSYSLYNILWLKGYFPRIGYFDEKSRVIYEPTLDRAKSLAEDMNIPYDDMDSINKIHDYMKKKYDEKGILDYPVNFRYIWLLWDVTEHADRSGYEISET